MNNKEIAEHFFERAMTALRGHANEHALAYLVEAIKYDPELVEAWVVRGNIRHSLNMPFDALLHYNQALSINEDLHDAWNNRGLAFADLGKWDDAEKSFRKSAELMPALEPHMGLANMFCTLMRLEEAEREYAEAIKYGAGLEANFNRGVTLLGLGRWAEGFPEYEKRWENMQYPPRAYRSYPKWRGEDLTGKRIVLYPEQGYGDEILALRFALDLYERFRDVYIIIETRSPMLRLAQDMQCDDERASAIRVVLHNSGQQVRADYSCPLLDLPIALKSTPGSVSRGRYLRAPYSPQEELYDWRERLAALPKGLNVGLCWNSGGHLNTAQESQRTKSIPLPRLRPLVMGGVNLISLQYPQEPIPPDFPITDWMADCHDFADTAALIEELDLVISVDTSVAHLAGALGKLVWNFVRLSGYWPWLTAEAAGSPEYSIWYPSMKLLRQSALGDWRGPIALARQWLAEKAAK